MELEDECGKARAEASEDRWDPERLMDCPFDKHHKIRACRFPYHLVKCSKSHPEAVKQLARCPFNARHLVPYADLGDHIRKCDDQGFVQQHREHEASRSQREQRNAVSTWQAPPCEEDWEKELLEEPDSHFVWRPPDSGLSSSSTSSELKNVLPAGVRAPTPSQCPRKYN